VYGAVARGRRTCLPVPVTRRLSLALSTSVANAEPGSSWLQYSMIEQLADDVRMTAESAQAEDAIDDYFAGIRGSRT
jgi:hypothetical protein